MDLKKTQEDSIVEFIKDEAFLSYKKNKESVENGTIAIFVFATVTLLSYTLFLLFNNLLFDWFSCAVTLLIIFIYYCLAVYSKHEPFNAFVSIIILVVIVMLSNLFIAQQLSLKAIIINIVLIVYLSMRLQAANKVQSYNKKPIS